MKDTVLIAAQCYSGMCSRQWWLCQTLLEWMVLHVLYFVAKFCQVKGKEACQTGSGTISATLHLSTQTQYSISLSGDAQYSAYTVPNHTYPSDQTSATGLLATTLCSRFLESQQLSARTSNSTPA